MLVDTSVWIDHFRARNDRLSALLEAGQVWVHPLVIGELACGDLPQRRRVLALLSALPGAPESGHDEVMDFIETHALFSKGLGLIDMHLLRSAQIAQLPFWTLDKRLAEVAHELGLAPV